MDKKMRIILKLLGLLILCAFMSGCRMLPIFQRTPVPLETVTPQLSLNQVTDIPTLPPVTATPTLSMGEAVIIRQRRNPTLQRLRAFDRYCFHLPDTPPVPEHKLPEAQIFDLKEEFEKKKPKKKNGNTDQKEEKQKEIETNGSVDLAADHKPIRKIKRHTTVKTKEMSS